MCSFYWTEWHHPCKCVLSPIRVVSSSNFQEKKLWISSHPWFEVFKKCFLQCTPQPSFFFSPSLRFYKMCPVKFALHDTKREPYHPHSTMIFLWLILPQRKHFINNFTESWQFLFTEMNKIESATHNFRDPQVFWQFYKVSFVIQMGSPGVHGVGMEVFFIQCSRHGFSSAHSPPPLISGAGENRWRENSKWCIFFAPLETFG